MLEAEKLGGIMNEKPMTEKRIALVTGANRGMGLATAEALALRGYRVVMVGRDAEQIRDAAQVLNAGGSSVEAFVADITDDDAVSRLSQHLTDKHGRLDVLVNNAGVILEHGTGKDPSATSVFHVPLTLIRDTLEINTLGALRLIRIAVPLMQRHGYGRIVNVSSGMGALSDMDGRWPGYRLSKTGLNALTRIVHAELAQSGGHGIKINSVCPGWVRTDLGGPHAPKSIAEGIAGIVWAATLPESGPSGGFFRDGKPIDW